MKSMHIFFHNRHCYEVLEDSRGHGFQKCNYLFIIFYARYRGGRKCERERERGTVRADEEWAMWKPPLLSRMHSKSQGSWAELELRPAQKGLVSQQWGPTSAPFLSFQKFYYSWTVLYHCANERLIKSHILNNFLFVEGCLGEKWDFIHPGNVKEL